MTQDNRKVLRAHWPPRKHGNMVSVDLSAEIYENVYLAAHDNNHSLSDEIRLRLIAKPGALLDIDTERASQIVKHGWLFEHDDTHTAGELSTAAAAYASVASAQARGASADEFTQDMMIDAGEWPWRNYWKPKDMRRNLVKAAALIVAEIQRIDRAQTKGKTP